MAETNITEVWLRGPLQGVPILVQPVAHALLQAREEVNELMTDFNEDKLWDKPAGLASVAFHLQHLTGVLDRLFTYAKGMALNNEQLAELKKEGKQNEAITVKELVDAFNKQVEYSLAELAATDESKLAEKRGVGRAQLPSTVIGLLVHSAEHTMRHVGQLLVTVKVVNSKNG